MEKSGIPHRTESASLAKPPTDRHISRRYSKGVLRTGKKKSEADKKTQSKGEKSMCRKLVVTNKISLGTREICWEAYSLPKGEVVELTAKQLKDAIKGIGTDEVYGLTVSEETGELVFDKEGFFTVNMMNKIHTNTLVPMVEEDCLANLFYIVIGSRKTKQGMMYDVVSSRYERTAFSEEKTRTLLDMKIISGGAKLENGEIVTAVLEKKKEEEKGKEGAVKK